MSEKDAASKTGKKTGKKTCAGIKKVFKCGGAAWKKSESGCGAIHPSGAGVNLNNVKKLPCPADDPSCPKYVNPSKKQKSVASFFGKKS